MHMKIPEEFEQLVRGIDPEGPKLESLQSLATAALRLAAGALSLATRSRHPARAAWDGGGGSFYLTRAREGAGRRF